VRYIRRNRVKVVDAVNLVKAAAEKGGVAVEVLFQEAYAWGLGTNGPFDVGVEVKDFLAFSKDEDSGYFVPDGVIKLADLVHKCENPRAFFANREKI
jgi:hypothetical protein